MTTVPNTPRLSDFSISLVDLSDGTSTPLAAQDIIAIDWWSTKGATGPRFESGNLECPSGTEAAPSKVYSAINWTTRQALRITPYGDTTKEVWGLVVKYKLGYSENGRRDSLKINLAPIEYLLHSRLVYDDGEQIPGAVETADDFAKKLVRLCAVSGSAQVDPDGNSRVWNWGTLAVEADSSEVADTMPVTYREELSYLDEVLKALGVKYGFDWELKPTIGGGALTFTFNTKSPRGGTDRTSGANRAIIQDFASVVPAANRHFDMVDIANAVHSASLGAAEIDATSISTYGRWEAFGPSRVGTGLAIDVTQGAAKEGSSFTVDVANQWLKYWDSGDLVLRANTRLGIAAANVTIEAVHATFVEKILKIEIRWGDKEATLTDKTKGGAHRPIRRIPNLVVPLSIPEFTFNVAHVEGEAFTAAPTDSVIALGIIADDADVAYPDSTNANRWTLQGTGGIVTAVDNVDPSIITVDGSGLAPATHTLLDGTVHSDTVAATVSVGSLVVGTTNGWDELDIGANGAIMISNGTMAVWTGGVARGDLLYGDATPMWNQLSIGVADTFLKSDGTDMAWAGIGDGSLCYWQRTGTTLFQDTLGDIVEVQTAGGAAMLRVTPATPLINSDQTGSYGKIDMGWWDIINAAGTDAGIHDIHISGDVYSYGTASKLVWGATDDAVYTTLLYVSTGVAGGSIPADHGMTVAGTTGNTVWKAAATLGWEGATYRMPQDVAAVGEVLAVASIGPNVLEWAASPTASPGTLTVATGNVAGVDHTHAITTSSDVSAGGAAILASDASGHLRLERLYVGAGANYVSTDAGDTNLELVAVNLLQATAGGVVYNLGWSSWYPAANGGSHIGLVNNRWGTIWAYDGNFADDVTISDILTVTTSVVPAGNDTGEVGTALLYWNKGYFSNGYFGRVETDTLDDLSEGGLSITAATTVSGLLTASSGLAVTGNITVTGTVDGVDIAAFKTAYDAHVHVYEKATKTGNNTNSATNGTLVNSATWAAGSPLYFYASLNSDGSSPAWQYAWAKGGHHVHEDSNSVFTYANTNSGVPT